MPNYERAADEVMNGLETLARVLTLDPSHILTDLTGKLGLNPNMKRALDALYNWAGDVSGVRHGRRPDAPPSHQCTGAEGRLVVVMGFAVVRFLLEKDEVAKN